MKVKELETNFASAAYRLTMIVEHNASIPEEIPYWRHNINYRKI